MYLILQLWIFTDAQNCWVVLAFYCHKNIFYIKRPSFLVPRFVSQFQTFTNIRNPNENVPILDNFSFYNRTIINCPKSERVQILAFNCTYSLHKMNQRRVLRAKLLHSSCMHDIDSSMQLIQRYLSEAGCSNHFFWAEGTTAVWTNWPLWRYRWC